MVFLSELPSEILEQIFEYCKILPLTLVCQKFSDVIDKSPKLMKKLELIYSEKFDPVKVAESKRKYQSIHFKFNYKINKECLEVLTRFNFKSLQLVRCIIDAQLFLQFLESLPNLETLLIFTTHLKNKDNFKLSDPPTRRLKYFNYRNSDIGFLAYLKNSKIKKFSTSPAFQYPIEATTNFIRDHSEISFIDPLLVNQIDDSLLICLAQNMKNLTKLYIHDTLKMEVVRNLELTNTTVQHLIIYSEPQEGGAFNFIVGIFRGVKILEIEMNQYLEEAKILRLKQQLPSLESLSIIDCSGDYFQHLQLRNLKHLTLNDGNFTSDDWVTMANRNPSLESIILKDESMTDETFRTICVEFMKLKHFEMFYDPQRLTSEILNFISDQNFPRNIRFLKVTPRNRKTQGSFTFNAFQKRSLNSNLGFQLFCI